MTGGGDFTLDSVTVAGGVVTAANFQIQNGAIDLDVVGIYNELDNYPITQAVQNQSGFAGATYTVTGVPEPASLAILGAVVTAIGWVRRRRRSA